MNPIQITRRSALQIKVADAQENKKSFDRLPQDVKDIVTQNVNAAGLKQRDDVKKPNDGLQVDLKAKGTAFNATDAELFRNRLRSAGFYAEWHKKFGEEAWAVLEKYTGRLR